MSTNITIDVVLAQLKEQAKKTADKNREDRLTREEQAIFNGIINQNFKADSPELLKLIADAGLTELEAAELLAGVAAELNADGPSSKLVSLISSAAQGLSNTYQYKRPAAQRLGGSVIGVQWWIVTVDGTPTLRIGPPGWQSSLTVPLDTLSYTLPPNYGLPVSGTGYVQRSDQLLEMLLLPHSEKGCVAVLLRNQIFRYQTFTYSTTYDPAYAGGDDLYEVRAFYVGRNATREIDVPSGLDSDLRGLYPPMKPNATVTYSGGPFFVIGGAPSVQVGDMYSAATWRASRRYGDYYADNDTLARQFGMGLLTTNHRAVSGITPVQYSPAVYRFITGPMALNSDARNYDHMRQSYYGTAPEYYLGKCVLFDTCTSNRVGFDVTREVPVDIYTGMDPEQFKRKRTYDVAMNGADPSSYSYYLSYAWNWDNKAYCSQRLAALGFTTADLSEEPPA